MIDYDLFVNLFLRMIEISLIEDGLIVTFSQAADSRKL